MTEKEICKVMLFILENCKCMNMKTSLIREEYDLCLYTRGKSITATQTNDRGKTTVV